MTASDPLLAPDLSRVLVLSGGNALGAYQAGAYEALAEAGLRFDWVVGCSIGAVNGALIAGNPPEHRVERLRAFWRPGWGEPPPGGPIDQWRRTGAVASAMAGGRPGLFAPPLSNWNAPGWSVANWGEERGLYDSAPLAETVAALADLDRAGTDGPRFSALAVDVETGEEVVFDTARGPVTPEHVRASGSLFPAFPPVRVDDRLLGDGGLSANLPLDPVLADPPGPRTLVVAFDLLPPAAPPPTDLGETIGRLQDLNFACQSRRTIAAWRRWYDARLAGGDAGSVPSVTLAHLVYADQGREVAGKAFDFSPSTVRDRWDAGRRDAARLVEDFATGAWTLGGPGLAVHRA